MTSELDFWGVDGLPKPDFVISGGHAGDGRVILFASKELSHAEITTVAREQEDYLHLLVSERPRYEPITHFRVQMGKYVMVVGKTYAQAFDILFKEWSPDGDEQEGAGQLYAPGRFGTDETGTPRGVVGSREQRTARRGRLPLPPGKTKGDYDGRQS